MKRLSILTLFLLSLTQAQGLYVKDIVAFGDSLSCTGNACLHSSKPDAICMIYPQGRFTDGDLWIETLAEKLGVARPKPSLVGGLNFAYGGATTGWKKSSSILNVGNQIKEFLKRDNGRVDPDNLYIIWAGGNDIKNKILPLKLISNLENHIIELARGGARTFLVPNFPPLGKTPIVEGAVSFLSESMGMLGEIFDLLDDDSFVQDGFNSFASKLADTGIQFFNFQLNLKLRELERSLGVKIYRFDAYEHFHSVMDNFERYGLNSPNELFLYDGFHPSAKGHKLIAEGAFELLKK